MRGCFISILIFFGLLIITLIIFFSYEGSDNLYYIEEADIYIKTFPESDTTTIIAFSDKKIGKLSDTLDYIKVRKGVDYGTGIFFDPNNKNVIYISGNSLIDRESHWVKYSRKEEINYMDNEVYYKYNEYPYTKVSFSQYGFTQNVSLKNRNDIHFTKLKPIN